MAKKGKGKHMTVDSGSPKTLNAKSKQPKAVKLGKYEQTYLGKVKLPGIIKSID